MKKLHLIIAGCLALACIATLAIAGAVGDRRVVTLATATGAGSWENPHQFASITLHRVSVLSNLNATNQVTASRIISEGATSYTQTVGTVTAAAGVGTQATLAHSTLLLGDKLVFSSLVSTGGVVIVEYTVNQH